MTPRWRCAFDWSFNSGSNTYCGRCGRDIMVPGPVIERRFPGRPRMLDGDGKEAKRAYDRERKARKKAEAAR